MAARDLMRSILMVLGLCLSALPSHAAPTDGNIVAETACEPHSVPYQKFVERAASAAATAAATREKEYREIPHPTEAQTKEYEQEKREIEQLKLPTAQAYDELFHGKILCRRIRYLSDGLQVVGYVLRPSAQTGRLPVIFFARGGNRELGRIDVSNMSFFLPFLRQNYIVVATQYRGAEGGEGRDEYGGADVHDLINLVPLVRAQPWAHLDNLFLYGVSRGGLEAWIALRAGMQVRAAAIHAGVTDLKKYTFSRPGFEELWAELVPGYKDHKKEFFDRRSAQRWAAEIKTPVLLLHGSADWRVATTQTLDMASRLQSLNKEYELVIYAGDDHGLTKNLDDAFRHAMAWFAAHGK